MLRAMEAARGELLRRNAARWEIYARRGRSVATEVKDGVIDAFAASEGEGLAVRILDAESMGFAYTTDLSRGAVARMVEDALTAARLQTPDAAFAFPAPGQAPGPGAREPHDDAFERAEEDERTGRALAIEAAALSGDARLKRVRKASYSESVSEVWIENSLGLTAHGRSSLASAGVSVLAEEGGNSEMGWASDFSRKREGFDIAAVGREAARKALAKLGGRPLATRRAAVLFGAEAAADLLGVLAASFLGDRVVKGKSLLARRLGEQVAAPCISVIDDSAHPAGPGALPFDGEGVARRAVALIEGGILSAFLFNTYWGRRAGVHSTGHAARGLGSPPGVAATCLFLAPGNESPEALRARARPGLLVTELLGLHTANPVSGDFSLGATGQWLDASGEFFPVRGVTISGNILDLFAGVAAVGADLRFFGSIGAPGILVSDLQVAGA